MAALHSDPVRPYRRARRAAVKVPPSREGLQRETRTSRRRGPIADAACGRGVSQPRGGGVSGWRDGGWEEVGLGKGYHRSSLPGLTRQTIILTKCFLRSSMDTRVKPAYDDCNCRWRVHHICCRHTIRRFVHPGLHSSNGDLFAAATSRSRGARALRRLPPSIRTRGRRESRVRAAPAVSCANMHKKTHTSIQVQRRHPGLPCAMVYGLLRALPGERLFLPPSSARSFASRELDTSVGVSGPHGFTVRSSHARQSQLSRPPHPTARS